MYFDFEDQRPDTPTIARALSPREGVMLSTIIHLVAVILILVGPHLPFMKAWRRSGSRRSRRSASASSSAKRENRRFVFVQPRVDHPGAEAAAARRSLRHRPPGAHHRAGAEADEPAAVRPRQHLRADRGRAAGARPAAPRRRSPSRRSRSPIRHARSRCRTPRTRRRRRRTAHSRSRSRIQPPG